jgi:anhydro-N-acetylmuramic acid kinase
MADVRTGDISFVGSHGHTLYHAPYAADYLGYPVRGTLQMGEPSLISEALGCMVVSDFRVRDMAAGGQGAPLVPYTEYLLYRREDMTVALQNIGGIGNITVLPKGGNLTDTYAFDTGPGNMVMDELASRITNGTQRYDDGGRLAKSGAVSRELLQQMLEDPYLMAPPPKSTGREVYGKAYVDDLVQKGQALGLSLTDILATATRFTAETIQVGIERFIIPSPERLIVGGGGSMNPVLMRHIADSLPGLEVIRNEDLGLDSNAKEAIAFAILANETLHMHCSNVPAATGAGHPAILGKISF